MSLAAPVENAELDRVSRARAVARLLGIRNIYRETLRADVEADLAAAWRATEKRRIGTGTEGVIRNAVLGINGYQSWANVLRSNDFVDHMFFVVLSFTALGSLAGSVVYVVRAFSWARLGLGVAFVLVALIAGVATVIVGLVMSEVQWPRSRNWRSAWAALAFAGAAYGLWRLLDWKSFWGEALFAGLASATLALAVLAISLQVARFAINVMFRYTWKTFTVEEIIESLASALSSVAGMKAAYARTDQIGTAIWQQTKAAQELDHVATCMERYLLSVLVVGGDRAALSLSVWSQLQHTAARVRLLARDCLLSERKSRDRLEAQIADRLVSAAEGHWGAWESRPIEDSGAPPKRQLWAGVMAVVRTLLKVGPVILVGAGAAYLYLVDPGSALLDPQVIGAVSAAMLAYIGAMVNSGLDPRRDTKEEGSSARDGSRRGRKAFGHRL